MDWNRVTTKQITKYTTTEVQYGRASGVQRGVLSVNKTQTAKFRFDKAHRSINSRQEGCKKEVNKLASKGSGGKSSSGKSGGKGSVPNAPSKTGNPSGKGRGNAPSK